MNLNDVLVSQPCVFLLFIFFLRVFEDPFIFFSRKYAPYLQLLERDSGRQQNHLVLEKRIKNHIIIKLLYFNILVFFDL